MNSHRNRILPLAASIAVLLKMSTPAHAANLYWDSNGTAAGLGNTAGTWGSSAFFRTISNPDGRGLIDGTLSPATTASAAADTVYFGTVNLGLGATGSSIAIAAAGVTARVIVFGAGQGSQGVTLSGGGGKITMDGAAGVFPLITANNTGINTIGAELAGTLANALGIYGPGTVLLTGANTFTGGLVVRNGATLQVGNGTSGSLTSQNLTFNNGAGVFNVRSLNAGSTQAMGTLTFNASGIGDGTVQSTYGTSGNAVLSFSSLAARGLGATGNFVVSGGDAATNRIVLSGTTGGTFLDKGLFFGGSSYVATDTGGTLYARALIYGTDTDTVAVDTITASKHVKLTSSPAARTGDTLLSLNLSGAVDYTMNAGSLTVPAILKSGGGVSTISGGTSLTTASDAELVIRTDLSTDLLTISSAVTGFNTGLTKTGAGTLTLSGTNGYNGNTRINAGTLAVSGGSAITNTAGVVLANAAGATFKLDSSETIGNLSGGGFSGGNVNVGANTLTINNAATQTFGGTFSGTSAGGVTITTGTLTLSNKNTFAGAITLNGTSQLSLTYGNEATTAAQSLSSGGAINMAGGTTLNFTPGSNLLVGTIGTQLNNPNGWTIGNDIKVTSGTANITFGASNGSRFTFTGGVSGSSTPATNTILAVNTTTASFDNSSVSFSGVIQDGSGGSLGLNLTSTTANAPGAFISLTNSNTFTGAISLNTTSGGNGFVVIGGLRNSAGLTTGSGSLGSGGVYSNTIALTNSAAGVSILNYASSANQTLGGAISGTNGRLQKEGTGILTFSGTNSYSGGSTITTGTLVFRNTASKPGTGTHAFAAGTTLGLGVGGAGFFDSTAITSAFGSGTILTNVTVTATTNVAIDTTAGDFTHSPDITGSPTKSLAKLGVNTLTLGGANTYTGATTVSAGTLLVSGSLSGSSAVAVNNGGTLGGIGTIGGATTVANGGKLSPGDAGVVGTLNFGGNLTFSPVTTDLNKFVFQLGSVASSDKVDLSTGILNIGSGVGFSEFAFTTVSGFGAGTYTLFETENTITGLLDLSDLTGTIGGLAATLSLANLDSDIVLTVLVPEPSSVALLGLGVFGLMRRRRRA